jgi:hypothetical protein
METWPFYFNMEKEQIQTMSLAADTVITRSISFEIIIVPKSKLHRWMQRNGLAPKKKQYIIAPIVLGNLVRISRLLLSIDWEGLQEKNLLDKSYRMASQHMETLAAICAIAIANNRNEPSGWLMNTIRDNLSSREMMTLVSLVLRQMDLTSFIASIISMKGLNVLESEENMKPATGVSPSTPGS